MRSMIWLIFVVSISIVACKQDHSATTQDVVATPIPDDFQSFYTDFHSDSLFQMQHILFPLDGMTTDNTQGMALVHTKWHSDNWLIHMPFDAMGGTYNRDLFNMNGLIIEHIKSYNGEYGMERRFSKIDNQWMLIYYTSLSKY